MTFLGLEHLPWILGALGLGALVLLWSARVRRSALKLLAGGRPQAPALRTSGSPLRRRMRALAMLSALVFLAITILRPTAGSITTEVRLPAKNLVILIDVSKSMGVADSDGLTRVEAAKLFAREFISRRPADRIGLVSFDGVAFPECPTTLSRTMLLQRLDLQAAGGLPVHGSDLDAALEEAAGLLTEEPPPGSAVILLSDGDRLSKDPVKAAVAIAERGVPLFAIRFGKADAESPIPDSDLQSRANPETMRKLAEATGAIQLPGDAAALDHSLQELNSRIDMIRIGPDAEFDTELRSRPLELYAYPLALCLACLFVRFFLPAGNPKKWFPLLPSLILAVLALSPAETSAQTSEEPAGQAATHDVYPPFTEAFEEALGKKLPLLVLFTGSDWSESSIKFETEILTHEVYRTWAARSVVTVTIDLPRVSLDAATRSQRRALAARFGIDSFPTALFLNSSETELGRLGHDPAGPASWVRRADLILAGQRSASNLDSSIEHLPDSVRRTLNAPGLTPAERAIRYHNQALEYKRLEPELARTSPDRFRLLEDLLSTASSLAPDNRTDLAAEISNLRATLNHDRGRNFLPQQRKPNGPQIDEAPAPYAEPAARPEVNPKLALGAFNDALAHYRETARSDSKHSGLTSNLALLQRDMRRARDLIAFQDAYKEAVLKTYQALNQEDQFLENLDRWVTTSRPVNDEDITACRSFIARLLELATAVGAPMLEDIREADEDIRLVPNPHRDRRLHASDGHIQDAYDHLVQPQESQGSRDDDDPFARPRPDLQDPGEDGDRDGDEEQPRGGGDQDLRRSHYGSGDLRDRQLDQLGRDGKKGDHQNKGQDH